MEYIGDTDRTLQFVVLYKEETSVLSPRGRGRGGGGTGRGLFNKVLYWEVRLQGSTSYPLKYHF